MLPGTYGPWYLQGRQFGLYLVSQRLLGNLYSFLLFIRSLNLCWSYFIHFFPMYVFMTFLFVYLITLFFSLSILSLFSSLLAFPAEVRPLNNRQMWRFNVPCRCRCYNLIFVYHYKIKEKNIEIFCKNMHLCIQWRSKLFHFHEKFYENLVNWSNKNP